ncbi:gamma-glutamyl-gamma-aminobutyrate hydrolase family protein [Thermaerobacter sp. PB12/4term]|uniref:gamma-glutamyl-gamma-aminobutyrate hydrolase family protein n=1 Tax=Thermaerobacter sp. PB12/4term TaxID=2293838 RepID=UPI000E32BE05|nr:gamma-glutamyl-gamma-aminobutyrate hydrolase family protein [Thermaerobacter sp. PB12/4term]QIA27668.1 gamma-glutamyl-gamma-aminobutyrate hydrolase family protein [Thermaerobacter sp. PB12/4term]
MARPRIGLTSSGSDALGRPSVPRAYLTAVALAGGEPVVLDALDPTAPPPEEVLNGVDGIILVGGGDVDPAYYGADLHRETQPVAPARDAFELALVQLAIQRRVPLLGICRGAQVMNVALGGDLIQHIPECYGETVPHSPANPAGPRALHPVRVVAGSRLHQILEKEVVEVRSRHHQAANRPAPGLRVVATADDGVVEAVEWEDPAHPLAIGVQWHPEDGIEDNPVQQRLFQALVAAARKKGSKE